MNIKSNAANAMPLPTSTPSTNTEAMQAKAEKLKAAGFEEGTKESSSKLSKDAGNISSAASEIMKNVKEMTKDIKEIMKNPNSMNDVFPDFGKKPGIGKKPVIDKKPSFIGKNPDSMGNKPNMKGPAKQSTLLTSEQAAELEAQFASVQKTTDKVINPNSIKIDN